MAGYRRFASIRPAAHASKLPIRRLLLFFAQNRRMSVEIVVVAQKGDIRHPQNPKTVTQKIGNAICPKRQLF